MSAYLSIMVHNTYGPGMTSSVSSIKDLFETKYFVYLYLDNNQPIKLRAARQPHVIEVTPGAHRVIITRKQIGKTGFGEITNILGGAAVGAAIGGSVGSLLGSELGEKFVKEDYLKGAAIKEFHDGETISCDVKADFRGMPKIQWC